MDIQFGDPLTINLQLYDGTASMPKRVFVDLTKPDGTFIESRFEIPHVVNGDFRDETRLMTSDYYLTAQYFVYESDGVTIDEDYVINKDIFMRDVTGEIVEGLSLDASVEVTGTLEGVIKETILDGDIFDETPLEGIVIEDNSITGEIQDE